MAQEITVFGKRYQISEAKENYAKVRREFENLADKYLKEFLSDIDAECRNAKGVLSNVYHIAEKYYDRINDIILGQLASAGIYTIASQNLDEIAAKYGIFDLFDEKYESVEDIYIKIVGHAEEERQIRKMRKESRARFVGGGFGFNGAMKGMITAGMLNQATGIGHSIFNAFGNARTDKEKMENLATLYDMAKKDLGGAFRSAIRDYYLVMIHIQEQNNLAEYEWPTEEDENMAENILENFQNGRIPKDKYEDVLFQLFELNPYNTRAFFIVLEIYGDQKREIEKFASAHGIDIVPYKELILDVDFAREVRETIEAYRKDKEPIAFEKKANALKDKIKKRKKSLGYTPVISPEKAIEVELKKLIAEFKTIDGVTFETVEEANSAKKDIKKFYEYISINGIDSESLAEDIKKMDFCTSIITDNLEERIEKLKSLKEDSVLGASIKDAFKKNGFNIFEEPLVKKIFVLNVSSEFQENADEARKIAGISKDEKIVLIIKNKTYYTADYIWWVLTNANLYSFKNDDDKVKDLVTVPYLSIGLIRADKKGNLVTRIKGGVDRTTELELDERCEEDEIRNKLSSAIEEIYYSVAPLMECRAVPKEIETNEYVAKLDTKELRNLISSSAWKDLAKTICINDGKSAFNQLINKAQKYWGTDFDDELVYVVMVDSISKYSMVLTNKRCYIYGKVASTEQQYVFPIDKITSIMYEGKNNYMIFFDVPYFKANYFDSSSHGICFRTVNFRMYYNDVEGKSICADLKNIIAVIQKPIVEKKNREADFVSAIKDIHNAEDAKQVVASLNKDNILDNKLKKELFDKAQKILDKYANAQANKDDLEKKISELRQADISGMNSLLNEFLTNVLLDENDKNAIATLIQMNVERGYKLYSEDINNFFGEAEAGNTLYDQPVYTMQRNMDSAEKIAEVFIKNPFELYEDEVILVMYKNPSQFKRMPPSPPDADYGIVTNRRLLICLRGGYKSLALEDVQITENDILQGNCIHDKSGECISFDFPYTIIKEIEDPKMRKFLMYSCRSGLNEYQIVAREWKTFFTNVPKRDINKLIEKVNAEESKLANEILKLCDGYDNKSLKELRKIKSKLKKYNLDLADSYLSKIDIRINEIISEINATVETIGNQADTMDFVSLQDAQNKLNEYSSDCSKEAINEARKKLNARADALYTEKWNAIIADIDQMNIATIEKRISELQSDNLSETLKNSYYDLLGTKQHKLYEEIINKTIENYETLSVPELKNVIVKLNGYPRDMSNAAIKQIHNRIYEIHKAELEQINSGIESMSIDELKELKNKVLQSDYESSLKESAVKLYDEHLKKVYEKNFDDILVQAAMCKFEDAYKLCTQIFSSDAPAELRDKYSAKVQDLIKALYRSKYKSAYDFAKNIVTQRALEDDTFISNAPSNYSAKSLQESIEKNIRNEYPSYPYWEEPLAAHYVSKFLADAGYALTPEHFYIFGSSKGIYDLNAISGFTIAKKLMSSDIMLQTSTGMSIPLKTKHGKNIEMVADSLNQILATVRNLGISSVNVQVQPAMENVYKEKETDTDKREEIIIDHNAGADIGERLRPLLEAHAQAITTEYTKTRVLCWPGDPDVIKGEKSPLIVVANNVNFSPKLMGEDFFNEEARWLLNINTDFFYMFTEEAFVLYVKGEKYRWSISSLSRFDIKIGFLSTSLLVTDAIGNVKKIAIQSEFSSAHVTGMNKILEALTRG